MKKVKFIRQRGVNNGKGVITKKFDGNGVKHYFQNGREIKLPLGRPASGNKIPDYAFMRYIKPAPTAIQRLML